MVVTASVYSGIESLTDALELEAANVKDTKVTVRLAAHCDQDEVARQVLERFYETAESSSDARAVASGGGWGTHLKGCMHMLKGSWLPGWLASWLAWLARLAGWVGGWLDSMTGLMYRQLLYIKTINIIL